jgi:CheY-like chemotaxis protein
MQLENRGKVLVVEDHADTLRFMLRLLKLGGYTAHGASTIGEAVRIASREQCQVVIADLGLPDGSGLELLPALRRHYDGIKGIAVTGHDGAALADAARNAGFDAHLVKPVLFDDLLKVLAAVSS